MRLPQIVRWLMLALIVALVPATSHAGVFISVGFAPPVLPVYEQPPCPEPNLIWTPGYWGYGPDGYYWVPGAWVPAPYPGALWTPPYWGWEGGAYIFHDGYWGSHVGYYGGVNYGYGYMGVGYVGGEWRGGVFAYNTAVVHVDRVHIREVYIDQEVVVRHTIVRDSHVAYAGGPGGVHYQPSPQERMAMNERHMDHTNFQVQHESMARQDHNSYARFNGGRPSTMYASRPLGAEQHNPPMANGRNNGNFGGGQPNANGGNRFNNNVAPSRPGFGNTPGGQQNQNQNQFQFQNQSRMNQQQQQGRQFNNAQPGNYGQNQMARPNQGSNARSAQPSTGSPYGGGRQQGAPSAQPGGGARPQGNPGGQGARPQGNANGGGNHAAPSQSGSKPSAEHHEHR